MIEYTKPRQPRRPKKIKQTGFEYTSFFSKVQMELENFVYQVGIFPEDDRRVEVAHNSKKLIRVRNVGYKSRIKKKNIVETTNTDILKKEYDKGRNWIYDAFNEKTNKDAQKLLKLLKNFIVVEKQRYDFYIRNRQRCNGLIAIFRRYVDSNPYGLSNSEKTIELKGFDAYLRDSRQLQNSVTARLYFQEEKKEITRSDQKLVNG